jgi:tRNA(Arg) A34 adenosine deaminase TadA
MKRFPLAIVLAVLTLALSPWVVVADDEMGPARGGAAGSEDEQFMRQAFDLAIKSGKNGNHTFGALLVLDGKVVLTSENTVYTDKDSTRHAEINLLVKAKRELSPQMLRTGTLYTSTAPCMLCCSAMWYSGVKRVVYGVSYEGLAKISGFRDKSLPCDKLYGYTGAELQWTGPVLEEEGLKAFCCWPEDGYRSTLVKNLGGCEEMKARCSTGPR